MNVRTRLALRLLTFVPLGVLFAGAVSAAPQTYEFDQNRSQVGFTYALNGNPTDGVMPVGAADLLIDLDNLGASRIDVVLSPRKARAGFVLATEAMRSADVLAARSYPEIRFQTTQITGSVRAAKVTGELTLRGVTRLVTLDAQLFRQAGSAVGSHDHLSVLLTGSLDRTDFGATGYPDLVGPQIDLRILVRMARSGV